MLTKEEARNWYMLGAFDAECCNEREGLELEFEWNWAAYEAAQKLELDHCVPWEA